MRTLGLGGIAAAGPAQQHGEDLRLLRALRELVWLRVGGSGIEGLEPPDGLEGLTVEDRDDRAPREDSIQITAQARRN